MFESAVNMSSASPCPETGHTRISSPVFRLDTNATRVYLQAIIL